MDDIPQRAMRTAIYALDVLALDEELQPRVQMDMALLEEFGEAMAAGDIFPPVVVFSDANNLWLADGYHRWHVHKALELPTINCLIFNGTWEDALRYSLRANAEHGKRPTSGDFKKAYDKAVAHQLVEPWDAEGVVAIIKCSTSYAMVFTKEAREKRIADRDADVLQQHSEGLSNRKIAAKVGLHHKSVGKILSGGGDFQHTVKSRHPQEEDEEYDEPEPVTSWMPDTSRTPPSRAAPPPESDQDRVARLLEAQELYGEAGQDWHNALEALRAINAQKPVAQLFASRYSKFDHAFKQELDKAHNWLNEFHRRFTHDR